MVMRLGKAENGRCEREGATTDRQGFRLGSSNRSFMNQPLVALQIGLSGTWQPVDTTDYLYILVFIPFSVNSLHLRCSLQC